MVRPSARDLLTLPPHEWVTDREFKDYANRHGLRGYSIGERAQAVAFAAAYGGTVFTEHDGEGSSTLYQRSPNGFVDVLGFMVLVPHDRAGDYDAKHGASRVWWPGSPGDDRPVPPPPARPDRRRAP